MTRTQADFASREDIAKEIAKITRGVAKDVHALMKKMNIAKNRKAHFMKLIDMEVEKSLGMIEMLLKSGITTYAGVADTLDAVAEELEARGETELEQETSLLSEAMVMVRAAVKVTDADIKKMAAMQARNDHTGVRIYLAEKVLKVRPLAEAYKAIAALIKYFGYAPHSLSQTSYEIDEKIKPFLQRELDPDTFQRLWHTL